MVWLWANLLAAIAQAVGLFGMGTIRGFALASIVKKSFTLDLSPYTVTNEQFSNLSKNQHALVTNWYLRKDPKLLGILSPAAFLVEIASDLRQDSRAGRLRKVHPPADLPEDCLEPAHGSDLPMTSTRWSTNERHCSR